MSILFQCHYRDNNTIISSFYQKLMARFSENWQANISNPLFLDGLNLFHVRRHPHKESSRNIIMKLPFWTIHRLVGLVVKASASRAEDPGFESRLRRDFFGVESYQ